MDRRHAPLRVSRPGAPSLAGAVLVAVLIALPSPARTAAATVTIGGPFTLTAPNGAAVTDATYRGKWMLVFFGYTFCPDICPTTLNHIALAMKDLGEDAAKVQPIFITIDPARDTPDVMGQYAEAFDLRIVGLSGSPEQIAAVMEAYGAYSAQREMASSEGYLIDHSTYIYVMDPTGEFVIGIDSDSPSGDIADTLRDFIAKSAE